MEVIEAFIFLDSRIHTSKCRKRQFRKSITRLIGLIRMSPVGITMMVSRRYLFITQTRTLLEIPRTVVGVDGVWWLWWDRMAIQSQSCHGLSTELHLLRERFLVTQHPLDDLSAEIHLSVQLLLIVINHPNFGKQEIHTLHQGHAALLQPWHPTGIGTARKVWEEP